jgi:molybdopterin synthase sulfur carrier subunit
MMLKLRYFAWVRERIGKPEETIEIPSGIGTVGELMKWLASRGEEYAHAFDNLNVIRAAIDQKHVRADAALKGAGEVAFFPPMTGG